MARTSFVAFAALCTLSFAACGGGSSNSGGNPPVPNVPAAEAEGNDTSLTANALSATGSGAGTIAALGDQDWWSFSATAGTVLRVELHALRADQATWAANVNDPILTLFDTDGSTKLQEHDRLAEFWPHGVADLDFPAFRIPATGTYFLRVMASIPAPAGGNYVLAVHQTATPGTFQVEAEAPMATGSNDLVTSAEPIVPGTVFGWHSDNSVDVYSFNITSPSIVTFEVLAYRNGLSRGDANLIDLDATVISPAPAYVPLHQILSCFLYDPGLSYLIVTPGTYYVSLAESVGTAGDGEYFLLYSRIGVPGAPTESESNDTPATANSTNYNAVTFGNIAADDDYFKFFGTAGDVVAVQTYSLANAEGATSNIAVNILDPALLPLPQSTGATLHVTRAILQTSGDHYVQVVAGPPTPYRFRLLRLFGSSRETEPNDTVPTADALGGATTVSGVIDPIANLDHFSFGVAAGEVVTFHCYGGVALHIPWAEEEFDRFGSALAPRLRILDPGAVPVATSNRTPAGGTHSTQSLTDGLASVSVTYVAPVAGTYTLEVSDQLAGGGSFYVYVLERR